MFATGTGIAPFRGFAQYIEKNGGWTADCLLPTVLHISYLLQHIQSKWRTSSGLSGALMRMFFKIFALPVREGL